MKKLARLLAAALISNFLFVSAPSHAADGEPIRRAIMDFLKSRSASLPGPARFDIGPIKADGLPEGCRDIEVAMDAKGAPWGRTHVNARCARGATWSLFVPVRIHVEANYVISVRSLRAGQSVVADDIGQRRGDLAELPADVLTDPGQAIGKTLAVTLSADRPLRADMLRQPMVVRQGQNVRVVSGGAGFQVSGEGRAMANALAGQVVQVRLASGQVISGIAQNDGSIAVAH
jgi:flagella basal body P-ring formation protein FlgA